MNNRIQMITCVLALWSALCAMCANADEKVVLLDDLPRNYRHFGVKSDGTRVYMASNKFYVFDGNGAFIESYSTPLSSTPVDVCPLEKGERAGWFIADTSYAKAHVALLRLGGSEAKTLVRVTGKKDGSETDLLRLIADGEEESPTLDYKACDSLQKTDGKKKEVGKDVSAFAISAGGTIVYGITEDGHKPKNLDARLREHLPGQLVSNTYKFDPSQGAHGAAGR